MDLLLLLHGQELLGVFRDAREQGLILLVSCHPSATGITSSRQFSAGGAAQWRHRLEFN